MRVGRLDLGSGRVSPAAEQEGGTLSKKTGRPLTRERILYSALKLIDDQGLSGFSIRGLGDKLGVSFQQVQKYEKGVNRVGAARLQQIATALDVHVTFFYDDDGLGKRASDGKREVESLLFIDSAFSLRLLRAYSKVPQPVQRQFVSLIESIAEAEAT